ncbi:MAG: TMEM175 family protein [Alphaproteobacteria bacterium]
MSDKVAPRSTFRLERVAALTDGVFAIAITLLVLDVKVPLHSEGDEGSVLRALLGQKEEFTAWVISFVLIARLWMDIHDALATLKFCDGVQLMLNFALLAGCSMIPFAAALVGVHPGELMVTVIFACVQTTNGVLIGVFNRRAHAAGLHAVPESDDIAARYTNGSYHLAVYPAVGVFSIMLAYVANPLVGIVAWLAEPTVAAIVALRRDHMATPPG